LHPDAWGKGYAVEAAAASMDYAFDVLQWTTVIHLVGPANVRSRRVAQRLGSTLLGDARMPPPFDTELADVWGQTRDEWRVNRDRVAATLRPSKSPPR
jgi:RimJ/RimL family protein N-acetyltransferase